MRSWRYRLFVIGAVSAVASLGLAPASARTSVTQLPNLVPMPPGSVTVSTADDGAGPALRFDTSTANRGDVALDLLAEPTDPTLQTAVASQCVEWATHRACAARQPVGRFVVHPEHGHSHFEDYALYELRRFDKHGLPDLSAEGLAATGGKVSFCLIDVEQDRPPSHAVYEFPHPLYYTCLAVGVGFQGISPGWRDVYGSSLEGQQIELDGVAPGDYALVITVDPDNHLLETNDNDNVAWAKVRLTAADVG